MVIPVLVSCFLVVCLPVCSGFSRGAPRHACRNLEPLHGFKPQETPSPYTFNAHPPQRDDDRSLVNVTLSWDGSDSFKGFLVHARDASDELIGEFIRYPAASGFLECSSVYPKASITHKDASPKTGVSLQWRAPNGYYGPITFKATVVQEQSIFWLGHEASLDITEITTPDTVTTEDHTRTTPGPEPEKSGVPSLLASLLLMMLCLVF